MTASRNALLSAILLGALLAPAPSSAEGAAAKLDHHVLCRFTDPDITESSGLVDAGDVLYTMNDSGHGPVVYAVDARTCDTVATTTYSSSGVTDVEALAPGSGGALWVGDTGNNTGHRTVVQAYRVGAVDGRLPEHAPAQRYDLRYPSGAPDAEALLVHPRTGRLFVVTKGLLGGTVYRAPAVLSTGRDNALTPYAQVPDFVTDGAFLPDGHHVLLRTYNSIAVYTFPGFERVGAADLPYQKQGEGLAVGADGRILLSSEGAGAAVLEIALPARLRQALSERPLRSSTPTGAAVPDPDRNRPVEPAFAPTTGGVVAALALAALAGVGLLVRAARRRGPRRR